MYKIKEFVIGGAYDILRNLLRKKNVAFFETEFNWHRLILIKHHKAIPKGTWHKELAIEFTDGEREYKDFERMIEERKVRYIQITAQDFLDNQTQYFGDLYKLGLEKNGKHKSKHGSYLYGRMLSEKSGERWVRSNNFTRGSTSTKSDGSVPFDNKQPNGTDGGFKGCREPKGTDESSDIFRQ